MRDFTLEAYRLYLQAIKASYSNILTFAEFFSLPEPPDSFVIIRHDVDRKPKNALKMAMLENEMGVRSTYYFRTKAHVFNSGIIRAIAKYGHEIGYHYESLADTKGDMGLAINDFEANLLKLRDLVPIQTIAMHGSPLKPYDNRDMWHQNEGHRLLTEKYHILGEVYLDIDYKDVAYINDTGRNWSSDISNIRDFVDSEETINIENANELFHLFENAFYSKIVFQVHPERWTDSFIDYQIQFLKDYVVNFLKFFIKK